MHFSFYKFGGRGREHLVGQAEEGEFEPPTLLAAGGARPRRSADTFCLCLAPSVTNPTWESSKCVITYCILGQNSSAQTSPQLGPGLHMRGGAGREAWDLSFLPTFSLPSLTLFRLPLSCTQVPSSLLFLVFFLSSLFIQLASKRKPFKRGWGKREISLTFFISIVALFKVETLLEILRSSVSSIR